MAKPSKKSQLISYIAERACAPKAGEYDYPMADAYQAAHKLRGADKALALRAIKALEDARTVWAMWEEFAALPTSRQHARVSLGLVPSSWRPVDEDTMVV